MARAGSWRLCGSNTGTWRRERFADVWVLGYSELKYYMVPWDVDWYWYKLSCGFARQRCPTAVTAVNLMNGIEHLTKVVVLQNVPSKSACGRQYKVVAGSRRIFGTRSTGRHLQGRACLLLPAYGMKESKTFCSTNEKEEFENAVEVHGEPRSFGPGPSP